MQLSASGKALEEAIRRMKVTLMDNRVRVKIKTLLPTLIGKIVVDTRRRQWEIFNHSGRCIYRSISHEVSDDDVLRPRGSA